MKPGKSLNIGALIIINLRVKVCNYGLQDIRKEVWHAVADLDDSAISKAIVINLIDKQNNAYAKRVFSKQVESATRSLVFHKEADFCKLIRDWKTCRVSKQLIDVNDD